MHHFTVGDSQAGARLDRFLADALEGVSRSRIKALVEDGRVRLGGHAVGDPARKVKAGEEIALEIPPPEPDRAEAQSIPLVVLHEDDDLIVIDKPAGLVVHPAPGNPDRTLVNALLAHCDGQLSGIGGVRRPGIVHRLDKETSGVMVAAKTDAAHAGLAAQFAAHDLERAYLALVHGVPQQADGTIEGNIGRHPRDRKRMTVRESGGKPARTHYRVMERFGGAAALVECTLETGRTHQVRVHMAHIGHPLIGDPLYGGRRGRRALELTGAAAEAAKAFPRQALHAARLGFVHPVSGAALVFGTPPPADMQALIETLRDGAN